MYATCYDLKVSKSIRTINYIDIDSPCGVYVYLTKIHYCFATTTVTYSTVCSDIIDDISLYIDK